MQIFSSSPPSNCAVRRSLGGGGGARRERHTGARRAHENHTHAIGGLGHAGLALFELLDAGLEARDNVAQPLQFGVDDTHVC